MKTGKELFQAGIVTGALEQNVQQHGIDLRLKQVNRFKVGGVIPREGKTILPDYEEVVPNATNEGVFYVLAPGYYEVIFEEGCNIPTDQYLFVVQRSSVMRCGGVIRSSIYDAGFKTDHMGTFLQVNHPLLIEEGARIAQAYTHDSNPVEKLYDGQFQGDKQRKI